MNAIAERPNIDLDAAVAEAEEMFIAANPNSRQRYDRARQSIAGGISRSALHYAPFPLVFDRGEAQFIWDVDDHEYLDAFGDYTAGIFGHNHPRTRQALLDAFDNGIALNGPHRFEAPFAELLCARIPSFEKLRFCSSGTEANLFALSLARVATGRDAILVFEGAYHGGVFNFSTENMPLNYPATWVRAPFNDIEATRSLVETHAKDLAAILVEPMIGAGGCIPAESGFLEALREMATANDVLLVFDEVMTSRLGPHGMQGLVGVTPDLTSVSKFLGGGLTFGAFGGRADLMERYDPESENALPLAGTFSNNVLTMEAGRVALAEIYTAEAAVDLNARGDTLRDRLNTVAEKHDVAVQFIGMGSMMNAHFTREAVRTPEHGRLTDPRKRALLHLDLVAAGIFTARSGMIVLSLPMTDADSDRLVETIDDCFAGRKSLFAD